MTYKNQRQLNKNFRICLLLKLIQKKNKLIIIIIHLMIKLFQISLDIILGIIDELENTPILKHIYLPKENWSLSS